MKITSNLSALAKVLCAALLPLSAMAQPIAPDIASVSVDPETSLVTVKYYASPSASAVGMDIKYVYQTAPIAKAESVRKINNNAQGSASIDVSTVSSYADDKYSKPFRVAIDATDGIKWSQSLDKTYTSIYATSTFDYCAKSAYLKWNPYEGYKSEIYATYLYKISPQGLISRFSNKNLGLQDTVSIPMTYSDQGSCYYIQSEIIDNHGSKQTVTSNKTCPDAKFPKGPRFMNADYATALNDSTLEAWFTIDTKSEITEFRLWHATNKKGPFKTIDTAILGKTAHPFVFTLQDSMVATQRHFFMLVAYDECGDSLLASNMASNIVLELENAQLTNKLTWNEYYQWQGDVEDYYVMRSIGGKPYENIAARNQNTEYISYEDLVGDLLYNNGEFCYYIEAHEINNPWIPETKNGISRSNTVCIVKEARIFVPSSFNPLSEIPANRVFMPQGSFINIDEYHFIVWNRYDQVMFESDKYGESWDGNYDGKAVPEGVYMYKVNVGHHGGGIERKGTVAVVYKESK